MNPRPNPAVERTLGKQRAQYVAQRAQRSGIGRKVYSAPVTMLADIGYAHVEQASQNTLSGFA